jgi:hypothetical protein
MSFVEVVGRSPWSSGPPAVCREACVTSFAEADGSAPVTGIVSTPTGVTDGGEPVEDRARNTSQERQGPGVTHNWYGT